MDGSQAREDAPSCGLDDKKKGWNLCKSHVQPGKR
jgi:hypothetical protein